MSDKTCSSAHGSHGHKTMTRMASGGKVSGTMKLTSKADGTSSGTTKSSGKAK